MKEHAALERVAGTIEEQVPGNIGIKKRDFTQTERVVFEKAVQLMAGASHEFEDVLEPVDCLNAVVFGMMD